MSRNNFHVEVPARTCQTCGNTIKRRPHEAPSKYARRSYCDRSCATTNQHAVTRTPGEHGRYIIEEVEHLAGTDHPARIARRLGYTDHLNLRDALRRWGRNDLSQFFPKDGAA